MDQAHHHGHGIAWETGLWKRAPREALLGIAGFAVCCAGVGAILADSDGKEVDKWPSSSAKASVSVLISLLISVANVFLLIALNQGYEVAWWVSAMKGRTLRQLHFDLEIQNNYFAFLSREFRFIDKFVIAAIISLIVSIADGPLIQKATDTRIATFSYDGPLVNVSVSNATFPDDFSGFAGIDIGPDLMTPLFSNVSRAFSNRDNISLPLEGCAPGTTCDFSLPAPGFDVSCSETPVAFNFSKLAAGTDNNNLTIFDVTLDFGGQEGADSLSKFSTINITALYKREAACIGNMIQRKCVLRLATVRYNTTVLNGTATIDTWKEGQNDTIEFPVLPQPYALPGYGSLFTGSVAAGGFQTMLGGFYLIGKSLYAGSVNLGIATMTTVPYILTASGTASSSYLTSNISTYGNCLMTWDDPTGDFVNTMRELMFRSAIAQSVANESAVVPQQLLSHQTRQANTYQSHYDYLGITIAVMVVQTLAIFLLLFGWHKLGREVSLDHFEVARTLGAPLLQQGSSNNTIDDCLKDLKDVRLRYGEIPVEGTGPDVAHQAPEQMGHGYEEKTTRSTTYPAAQADVEMADPLQPNSSRRFAHKRLGLREEGQVGSIRAGTFYL